MKSEFLPLSCSLLTIADYEDKITLLKGNPTENTANKMIDLAFAKGWKLEDLSVTGSDEFVEIITEEIEKRMI